MPLQPNRKLFIQRLSREDLETLLFSSDVSLENIKERLPEDRRAKKVKVVKPNSKGRYEGEIGK
jgi:hypothetical protein